MQKKIIQHNPGSLFAIISALLFGASTPAAKYLLGQIDPWLLAGLLYFGSGIGLTIILALRYFFGKPLQEANLNRYDYAWLSGATFFGGIIGPVLLMWGLNKTQASTASLLLNLETVFTALIAWIIFKEHTTKKLVFGMFLIVIGSLILSWHKPLGIHHSIGAALIMGACAAWAIDNNLTRNISAANPLKIVAIKSFFAGSTNILLALLFTTVAIKSFGMIIISAIIGFIGYGLSIVCFILGLRHIGTGRTSAYSSMAPFVGAALSILFLKETPSWILLIAVILMSGGVILHLIEQHVHEHEHEILTHAHKHYHDAHHQHEHSPNDSLEEPHTHVHTHQPLRHTHPHFPDIHHRHKH